MDELRSEPNATQNVRPRRQNFSSNNAYIYQLVQFTLSFETAVINHHTHVINSLY